MPVLRWTEGEPPWEEIQSQVSFKYIKPEISIQASTPFVGGLIDRMCSDFRASGLVPDYQILVDVRYWSHLNKGDCPGLPDWHYDCFNRKDHPSSIHEKHLIYISGAGSRTEFEFMDLEENQVWYYNHQEIHRIRPATKDGPRLLVRVSLTSIDGSGKFGPPPVIRVIP